MTQFYIPACGDRLILEKDWEFDLCLEHRNMKFATSQGFFKTENHNQYNVYEGEPYRSSLKKVRAIVKAGMTLEVDRVYIRQFSKSAIKVDEDYDSVTFRVLKGEKSVKNTRFWVKLPDTYLIEYRQDYDSRYRDRVKAVKEVMNA
jgi:argininosuccinate lyase